MSEDSPVFFLAAGPSGGGKTSLLTDRTLPNFNLDDHAARLNGGSYQGIPTELRDQAFKELEKFVNRSFQNNSSFATETTLRTRWTDLIIERAHEQGYSVRVSYVAADDPQIHIDRVTKRAQDGGHSAPAEWIKEIYAQSTSNFSSLVEKAAEGKIDRLIVYDNSQSLARPEQLLRIGNQQVTFMRENTPNWMHQSLAKSEFTVSKLEDSLRQGVSLDRGTSVGLGLSV